MIVLTGQTKGGVGKSFLATNLAVILTRRNHRTILVDADSQQTSGRWVNLRNSFEVEPSIETIASLVEDKDPGVFGQELRKLDQAYDFVIVDCGGHDSQELRETLIVADLLLAPVPPTLSDIWGLADLNEVIGQAISHNPQLDARVIINKSPPINFHGQTAQALETIESLEYLAFAGLVITDRQTYQAEFQEGRTISDIEPKSMSAIKARQEMRNLANLVEGAASVSHAA